MSNKAVCLNTYPKTPELDKMKAITGQSQAIGEFIDIFLAEKGIHLCTVRQEGNNGKPRYVWKESVKLSKKDRKPVENRKPNRIDYMNDDAIRNPEFDEWNDGYDPVNTSVQNLLAEYFEIDMNKVEDERRAILAYIRGDEEG